MLLIIVSLLCKLYYYHCIYYLYYYFLLASRLEEKENEIKKEYNKVHERYTELLRSHCDLMERVKIMFGTDEATNNMPSLTNLAGTLKANFQKFFSSEDAIFNETYNITTSTDSSGPMSILPQRSDTLSNLVPRQAWIETEMSYDDTNTILEDVEELQKDKEKDKEMRDHSLTGMLAMLIRIINI